MLCLGVNGWCRFSLGFAGVVCGLFGLGYLVSCLGFVVFVA